MKIIYVTMCYPSDRELEALAGTTSLGRTHAAGLLVASLIFLLLAAYGLAFSALYDLGLVPLITLSAVSLLVGVGALFRRRFALWLALLIFPAGVVEGIATLYFSVASSGWYPSDTVAAFNASLVLYLVGLVVSVLLIIDRRSQLK